MPRPRLLHTSWPPAVGAVVAVLLILWRYDVGMEALAKFTIYVVVIVALPGVYFWRLLLAELHTEEGDGPTWFEDLSLGTIFGFGIQLPLYVLGVWIGLPLIYLILPVLVIVLSLVPWGRRIWTLSSGRADVRVSWVLAVTAVYAAAWLGRYSFTGHPLGSPPAESLSVDGTFHLALISELLHRFPLQVPFLLGERLDYHWFVHAQLAANHWLTGIDSALMLQRIMPVAVVCLTVTGLGAVALRLTGRPVAAAVAPMMLVVGGFSLMGPHFDAGLFTESYLSRRFVSSPSQAYAFMMALPAVMLLLEVLRPERRASRRVWITLALALLALSGSKATFMPIFLCGAGVLWLVQLVVRRRVDWVLTGLVALLLAVTLFAQFVLLGGNSGSMALAPLRSIKWALTAQDVEVTPISAAAMTVTMLLGWLLYGVGVVGLTRHGLWRDPRALWMLFCIPIGVAVPFIFFRSGLSQFWFQRSVAELIVLVSVWGLAQLLPNPMTKRDALPLIAAAAAAGVAAFSLSTYFESQVSDERIASLSELVATALAPIVVVVAGALAYMIARKGTVGSVLGSTMMLAVLLGLPLSHVYSLMYDTGTNRVAIADDEGAEFPPGAIPAGKWIAGHSDPDDIVATNVHCRRPSTHWCDNRSFWVAALTERRVVVEGWGYTAGTNEDSSSESRNAKIPIPDANRLEINDDAFVDPSEATVSRLVDTYDVRFLFVDKRYPADLRALKALDGMLRLTFHNVDIVVLEVLGQ